LHVELDLDRDLAVSHDLILRNFQLFSQRTRFLNFGYHFLRYLQVQKFNMFSLHKNLICNYLWIHFIRLWNSKYLNERIYLCTLKTSESYRRAIAPGSVGVGFVEDQARFFQWANIVLTSCHAVFFEFYCCILIHDILVCSCVIFCRFHNIEKGLFSNLGDSGGVSPGGSTSIVLRLFTLCLYTRLY
jgi:hypothetical protein